MKERKTHIRASSFALIAILVFLHMSTTNTSALDTSSKVMIHFINVGWGDAIFIDTPDKDVLIDGGRTAAGQIVLSYLTNLNITNIDLMIATHPHEDHINGLVTILNSAIEVNQVLVNNETYPSYFLNPAQQHNLTIANRGQTFTLSGNAILTVLNPLQPLVFPSDDYYKHYNNIVVKLQVDNNSFLFTGDANSKTEQNMLNASLNLQVDVLKVGIHGLGETTLEPATTQAFLDSVNPTYAVISCNYTNGAGINAPDRKVIGRLLAKGAKIYSTHILGTIVASTDGMSIAFSDNTNYSYVAELKGHTKAVYSTAWSPDGNILASGSKDGTVRLWNTTKWETVLTINAHPSGVWSVAWSPDGTNLASGGVEGKVRLWDPKTGIAIAALNVSTNAWTFAYSVSWSPDGSKLAAGVSDGTVLIFDIQTGQVLHKLTGHTQAVIATTWSSNGSRLASGSMDQSTRVWDTETGSTIRILRANTTARNDINGLAWSPDGKMLAAAGQDGNVRIWDPDTGSQMHVLGKSIGWTRGVAYSCDGIALATTGQDCFVHLWNASTGEKLSALAGHWSPIWSVAWSPDGTLLASGSGEYEVDYGDTRVLVWRSRTHVNLRVKIFGIGEVKGVKVWVDNGQPILSPINMIVNAGPHTIEVRYSFLETGSEEGSYVKYIFHCWDNGSTNNTRSLHLETDKTIWAYYKWRLIYLW